MSGLLKEAYQLTLADSPDEWTSSVKQVLDEAGFSYAWNNSMECTIANLPRPTLTQTSRLILANLGHQTVISKKVENIRALQKYVDI